VNRYLSKSIFLTLLSILSAIHGRKKKKCTTKRNLAGHYGEYTMLYVYMCVIMLPAFRNATDSGIFRFVFFAVSGIWFITSIMVKSNWIDSILPAFLTVMFFYCL